MAFVRLSLLTALLYLGAGAEDAIQQFSKDNVQFSVDIYKEIAKDQSKSFIASPLSAEIVLSLVAEGAKGETRTELEEAIHIGPNQQEAIKSISPILDSVRNDAKLLSANKIYVADGFEINKSLQNTASDVYQAGIQNVNFKDSTGTAGLINKWVEDHTNKKIRDLVKADQLSESTRLVLVNTLYFTAKWVHPFTKTLTTQKPFYTSETKTKKVDMMQQELHANFWHCGYLKAKFLELPFHDTNVTMTFILPDSKTGLTDAPEKAQDYIAHAKFRSRRVAVSIPKFTIRSDIDFVPILEQLGVRRLFSENADLTGISDKEGLSVSFVQQQAYINVTESGVEAAAATAVQISNAVSIQQSKTVTFNADHPFLYVLKDRINGFVLFIGSFKK